MRKRLDGLLDGQVEYFANAKSEIPNRECLRFEALTIARDAGGHDVRQKAHLLRRHALPFARRAAAALGCIERESRCRIARNLRFGARGKERPNRVPNAEERCGYRARGAANR